MRKLAPALIAALAVALLPAAAAEAKKDRCRVARGGAVVERTRTVLVYQRGDSIIACLRPNGRRYELGIDDGIYNTLSVDKVGRRTVTWTESYTPECKADCPPNVTGSTTTHRIDLRTGEVTDL